MSGNWRLERGSGDFALWAVIARNSQCDLGNYALEMFLGLHCLESLQDAGNSAGVEYPSQERIYDVKWGGPVDRVLLLRAAKKLDNFVQPRTSSETKDVFGKIYFQMSKCNK